VLSDPRLPPCTAHGSNQASPVVSFAVCSTSLVALHRQHSALPMQLQGQSTASSPHPDGQCHFQTGGARVLWHECVATFRWNLKTSPASSQAQAATVLLTPVCFRAQTMDPTKHHQWFDVQSARTHRWLCIASILICKCRVNLWPPHPPFTRMGSVMFRVIEPGFSGTSALQLAVGI